MDYREEYDRGRRYRGEGYYGGYYGYPPERDRERRDWDRRDWERRGQEPRRRDEDRGFFERAGDEVRSWFGDEDAERRRQRDERDEPRGWGGPSRGWGGPSRGWGDRSEEIDRDWARQWGYVEGRGGGREPQRSSPPQRYGGPSWTRDVGYGGEGWERYVERPGWGDPSAWGAERAEGPHAGRGPRGYTRSDERIREDVCDRLCEHGYVDASGIDVRVTAGEVTLQGTVPQRQQKRIAEDVAERVAGVREVHNNLRVDREGTGREGGEQPDRPFRAA